MVKQAQLVLPPTGRVVDVDGLVDTNGIKFIGKAAEQWNGSWRCLANIGGMLCIVEVTIKFSEGNAEHEESKEALTSCLSTCNSGVL